MLRNAFLSAALLTPMVASAQLPVMVVSVDSHTAFDAGDGVSIIESRLLASSCSSKAGPELCGAGESLVLYADEEGRPVAGLIGTVLEGSQRDGAVKIAMDLDGLGGVFGQAYPGFEWQPGKAWPGSEWYPGFEWWPGSEWYPGFEWWPGSEWYPGHEWVTGGLAIDSDEETRELQGIWGTDGAAIWGTGGVAFPNPDSWRKEPTHLFGIWGTGGVAVMAPMGEGLHGIWGTDGAAIWGTGGTAVWGTDGAAYYDKLGQEDPKLLIEEGIVTELDRTMATVMMVAPMTTGAMVDFPLPSEFSK